MRAIVAIAFVAALVPASSFAQASTPRSSPPSSSKPSAHKAGQTFKECRNCPEMVVIPSGSFMMGSPADEPDRRENERQHRVTIGRPYAIGKTEVTWDQWEACVRDRWCDGVGVEHALEDE